MCGFEFAGDFRRTDKHVHGRNSYLERDTRVPIRRRLFAVRIALIALSVSVYGRTRHGAVGSFISFRAASSVGGRRLHRSEGPSAHEKGVARSREDQASMRSARVSEKRRWVLGQHRGVPLRP